MSVPTETNPAPDAATPGLSSTSRPVLWNPLVIILFALLMGFEISSALVALNWHTLKRHGYAIFAWSFAIIYWLAIDRPSEMLSSSHGKYLIASLLAFGAIWVPVLGYPQIVHVRKLGGYMRRSWMIPIGLGICLNIAPALWDLRERTLLTPPPLLSPQAEPMTEPPIHSGAACAGHCGNPISEAAVLTASSEETTAATVASNHQQAVVPPPLPADDLRVTGSPVGTKRSFATNAFISLLWLSSFAVSCWASSLLWKTEWLGAITLLCIAVLPGFLMRRLGASDATAFWAPIAAAHLLTKCAHKLGS